MALNNYENVTEIIGKQYHFFAHILSVDKSHILIQVGSYLITIYISHYSAFSINSANSLHSCHIKSTIYFLHINEIIENEVNTGLALRYVTWALPWGLWVSFLLLYGLRETSVSATVDCRASSLGSTAPSNSYRDALFGSSTYLL